MGWWIECCEMEEEVGCRSGGNVVGDGSLGGGLRLGGCFRGSGRYL